MPICPICREGQLIEGKTTVTLERDSAIVLFKFVPAKVCENCESYFLSGEMTRLVLERAENSMKNGAELEVLRMAA